MATRFDTIPACDRRTSCHIVRAYAENRTVIKPFNNYFELISTRRHPVRCYLVVCVCCEIFYRATRMHSANFAVARCLSVRPSYADILSKRLNISPIFSPSGSQTILVFHTKRDGNIPTGTPLIGVWHASGYE